MAVSMLCAVVARNHVAVSHLLVKGYNPNANHLGAMPLSLAVENGVPNTVLLCARS